MKWLLYKFWLTLKILILTSRQTLLRADLDESKRGKGGKFRYDYFGKEKNKTFRGFILKNAEGIWALPTACFQHAFHAKKGSQSSEMHIILKPIILDAYGGTYLPQYTMNDGMECVPMLPFHSCSHFILLWLSHRQVEWSSLVHIISHY